MAPFNIKVQPHFGGLSLSRALSFTGALPFWGIAAGGAVSLFMSDVPLFQKDVLRKIPFVASYFVDTTPDSDKPF